MKSRIAALLCAVLVLLGIAGYAVADTGTEPVACTISADVLSCPLPPPVTVTETPAPVTVTETATVTVTASSSTPTTSVPATTPVSTTAASTVSTTATPSVCAGQANTDGGPDPWGGCWPAAGTTGTTGTLSAYTGSLTISAANSVVEGKAITGCINVTAAGVTIRNSKITCSSASDYAVYNSAASGAPLKLENVEVACTGPGATGIGDRNVNVSKANIHGCENGFDIDLNATITDSYIHDLYQGSSAHTDGFQSFYTSTGISITHSVFYGDTGSQAGTSAINISDKPSGSHANNVTVSRNLLAGGAFTLYCPLPTSTNTAFTENVFSRKFHPSGNTIGAYGPSTDCGNETNIGGNTFDTGEPLALGD